MTSQILKQSVGIDVSKDSLSACFCQQGTVGALKVRSTKDFRTNKQGLCRLHSWMEGLRAKTQAPLYVLMEATGVYHEETAYFLHEKGCCVCIVLPNRAKAYAKSLEQKGKNDRADARMLAQMALERTLPEWVPPSATMLTIKRLCRERHALLEEKTAVSNRLHALKHAYQADAQMIKRAKTHIRFLSARIEDTEADIRQWVDNNPNIKQRIQAVMSIPGVGFITAILLASETNGFALFKSKGQLVCYAGLDVVCQQSGSSLQTPGRISKKGNIYIRKALYFPAISAVQHSPQLRKLFDRVLQKTTVKMKAYVAVQRKLLVIIYALYKSGEQFSENHVSVKNPIPLKKVRQERLPLPE